jgi:hypothetical protein
MYRLWLSLAALAAAVWLSGCAPANFPTDPQVVLDTDIGDEFEIALELEPGAPSQWRLKGGYNQQIVQHLGTYYRTDGLDILTFRAVGAGRAELTFEYYLPNTGTPEEVRTFAIEVDSTR